MTESFEQFYSRKKSKLVKMKDIGRNGFYFFEIVKATYMPQHNLVEKNYVVERMKLVKFEGDITNKKSKVGQIEYRIGYYIVGKIGRAKDKWWWGQFCPMIPQPDFKKLMKKAKDEGTII